ncbi:hypothetical protein GCM10011313_21100 [Mycetocola zhadangensis]|nr:hypothetical protein GCM10011313_21100 [Mycetocola zhadangensis]
MVHANTKYTARRDSRRLAKASSRARSLLTATLLSGGALALGLASAGGTYALLNASVQTPAVTVTAGTFELRVNGAASSALGTWAAVTPATPVARSFTVTSVGDVPSVLNARIATTTSTAITANTQARLTPVANAAACAVGLGGPLADLSGYTLGSLDRLAAGQTKTYCLEVRLRPATPTTQSGQGVGFTLTIGADQEAR